MKNVKSKNNLVYKKDGHQQINLHQKMDWLDFLVFVKNDDHEKITDFILKTEESLNIRWFDKPFAEAMLPKRLITGFEKMSENNIIDFSNITPFSIIVYLNNSKHIENILKQKKTEKNINSYLEFDKNEYQKIFNVIAHYDNPIILNLLHHSHKKQENFIEKAINVFENILQRNKKIYPYYCINYLLDKKYNNDKMPDKYFTHILKTNTLLNIILENKDFDNFKITLDTIEKYKINSTDWGIQILTNFVENSDNQKTKTLLKWQKEIKGVNIAEILVYLFNNKDLKLKRVNNYNYWNTLLKNNKFKEFFIRNNIKEGVGIKLSPKVLHLMIENNIELNKNNIDGLIKDYNIINDSEQLLECINIVQYHNPELIKFIHFDTLMSSIPEPEIKSEMENIALKNQTIPTKKHKNKLL